MLYLSPHLQAADPPSTSWTFSLRFENDLFNSTDRFYTNGIKLNWISPDLDWFEDMDWIKKEGPAQDYVKSIISVLPYKDDDSSQRNFSFSIGQMMYTPKDTNTSGLVINDRPYAGWKLPTDFGTALIRPGGDTNAPADTSDIRYIDDYSTISAHLFIATTGRLLFEGYISGRKYLCK